MEDHKYLLRERFLLDEKINCLRDIEGDIEYRLEPRLMAVLLELAKNPNALVTRESLIRKIWQDYPGAEDGLNQAISSLRKFLADDTKEIIRTVPKKGYLLATSVVKQDGVAISTDKTGRSVWYIAAAALVVVVSFIFLFLSQDNGSTSSLGEQRLTDVSFPDLEEKDEPNYLNTITTTDSVGNRYRLTMIGDRRPEFYINDTLQADTEGYTVLVDKLAKELWKRQREAEKDRK